MSTLQRVATALLLACAALSGTAYAGDAVKLAVEPPKDTRSFEAGDPGIELQIVGIDAAGQRVGFGDKKLETSVTEGELVAVESPFKYRYVPPATSTGGNVKISAWLKQTPDVRGELSLPLVPRRPYARLVLVAGNTAVQLGTTIDVEVRGVRADGSTALVKDAPLTVASDGSVGKLEQVSPGVFRYTAPPKSETKLVGTTARLTASLTQYPKVAGELSLVMSAEAPPPAPGGSTAPAPTPTPPAAGGKSREGVLWSGGAVKLLIWRTKEKPGDEFQKERILPAAGTPLLAPAPIHRLRVEVVRDDVRKIELETWIGDKKNAPVKIDDADKDGRLRVERSKEGRLQAVIEVMTPEEKPLVLNVLLTTATGDVLRESFVLQRGRDRDNDGGKDKRSQK
jgi:hypothetical protein